MEVTNEQTHTTKKKKNMIRRNGCFGAAFACNTHTLAHTPARHHATRLEIAMDDALVVQVLDGPQEGPDEVSRLLLVVESLGHDAVEQLPS